MALGKDFYPDQPIDDGQYRPEDWRGGQPESITLPPAAGPDDTRTAMPVTGDNEPEIDVGFQLADAGPDADNQLTDPSLLVGRVLRSERQTETEIDPPGRGERDGQAHSTSRELVPKPGPRERTPAEALDSLMRIKQYLLRSQAFDHNNPNAANSKEDRQKMKYLAARLNIHEERKLQMLFDARNQVPLGLEVVIPSISYETFFSPDTDPGRREAAISEIRKIMPYLSLPGIQTKFSLDSDDDPQRRT